LVQNGANVDDKLPNGSLIDWIHSFYPNPKTDMENIYAIVKELLDAGLSLSKVGNFSNVTLVMLFLTCGHPKVHEMLLKAGVKSETMKPCGSVLFTQL